MAMLDLVPLQTLQLGLPFLAVTLGAVHALIMRWLAGQMPLRRAPRVTRVPASTRPWRPFTKYRPTNRISSWLKVHSMPRSASHHGASTLPNW